MIEVGVGAAVVENSSNPIDALFRIRALGATGDRRELFVIVRVNGDVSVGQVGARYVDFEFDAIGYESREFRGLSWGFDGISADISRNIPMNEELTVEIALLGVHGKIRGEVSRNVDLYLQAAADLLSLGWSQRATDDALVGGYTPNVKLEFGGVIAKRVRISISEKFSQVLDNPVSYETGGVNCTTYTDYDSYGNAYSYTDCDPETVTEYRTQVTKSKTTLGIVARLTRNVSLFAQGNFEVYAISDDTNEITDSASMGFQFLTGVSGRF